MDELRYDGRVAIVTGGGRGLGREHALLLARRGASVVVNDVGCEVDGTGWSDEPATSVVDEIRRAGGAAVANFADVKDSDAVQTIVDMALDEYGRLDIVVNNAGILLPSRFSDMKLEELIRTTEVHHYGTTMVCLAAWPHLRQSQYGRIVNTTSPGAFGIVENSAYSAAKAGTFGLTRTLALEGASDGIKVNCIAPAAWTRMAAASAADDLMTPEAWDFAKAAMPPQASAAVVGYLAHESCDLTGEVLSYSGGRLARWILAETEGVMVDQNLTPEAVASGLERIMAPEGYHLFTSADELISYSQQKILAQQ